MELWQNKQNTKGKLMVALQFHVDQYIDDIKNYFLEALNSCYVH